MIPSRSLRAQLLLLIGGGLVLLLVLALAGFGLLSRQLDGYQGLLEGPLEEARLVDATNLAFKSQVQEWKNVLLRGGAADQRERYWKQFQDEEARVQDLLAQLQRSADDPELRQRLQQLAQSHRDLGEAYRRGLAAYVAANFVAAQGDTAVKGIDRATSEQLSGLVTALHQRASDQARRLAAEARRTVLMVVCAMLAFAILIALLSAWLVNRRIVGPLAQVTEQLVRLSEGRFGQPLAETRRDEIGRLSRAANRLRDFFSDLAGQLRQGTGALDATTQELGAIAQRSGAGIRDQFSRTDQVATAMHEMSATAEEVARHSGSAATAANDADRAAQEGEASMTQTIATIERMHREISRTAEVIARLESDSDRIGSVLEVIRGIADQTNLLALNAAIEAARAGDAGRGFAVVADEVRSLAVRTASSISEIHQLIATLQGAAHEAAEAVRAGATESSAGRDQVLASGERLRSITTAVEAIRDMNRQIATAAEEQTSVAEDIARNLVEIVTVARHNEEDLQRTHIASERLQGVSQDLSSLAGRLRD
ncbi:methyl-accepting chemotaxis protein [Pseudomonas oryzihabitans]